MVESVVMQREGTRRQVTESAQAGAVAGTSSSADSVQRADSRAVSSNGAAQPPAPEELGAAVEEVELQVQTLNRSLRFSVDEGSGRTVIRVIDRETDELIRQIPPEDFLKIAESLREMGRGLLVESV